MPRGVPDQLCIRLAGRKKLTALVLGSDQERALRKAAVGAVQDTGPRGRVAGRLTPGPRRPELTRRAGAGVPPRSEAVSRQISSQCSAMSRVLIWLRVGPSSGPEGSWRSMRHSRMLASPGAHR